MQKQWRNHNVNLQLLTQTIQNTYTKRSLKPRLKTTKKGWHIHIILRQLRIPGTMTITVTGTPNNFIIATKATEYEDDAIKMGLPTTMFGGGIIIYSSIKIREELEKLEKEFWINIEETIATLVNTATKNAKTTRKTNN